MPNPNGCASVRMQIRSCVDDNYRCVYEAHGLNKIIVFLKLFDKFVRIENFCILDLLNDVWSTNYIKYVIALKLAWPNERRRAREKMQ